MNNLAVFFLFFLACSAGAQSQYMIEMDTLTPNVATATLYLSASNTSNRLTLRGRQIGSDPQVLNPSCNNQPLLLVAKEQWLAPEYCSMVTWTIRFDPALQGNVNAYEQRSLFFADRPWWLLSEQTSLLRSENEKEPIRVSVHIKGDKFQPNPKQSWLVPAKDSAPGFYAFGELAEISRTHGNVTVHHVADNANRIKRLGLISAHEQAFNYMVSLFPHPATDHLLVVWLGIDKKHNQTSGATGDNSLLVNYQYGGDKATEALSKAMTLMTVAHEQFHHLSQAALPAAWLNESLAQYYGLKALSYSRLPATDQTHIRTKFINPDRPIVKGLLGIQQEYDAGNSSGYPRFYDQGATFWAEIDRTLYDESKGECSLDQFLPLLLSRYDFGLHGELPQYFVARLRDVAGKRIDEIVAKYVTAE
ncbi:MAG: hypothetical protein K0R08_857 [Solimicrobium sp.]|jgi:hypothetical protein|nr:hypothetical protein [Solimicrobium sp.]